MDNLNQEIKSDRQDGASPQNTGEAIKLIEIAIALGDKIPPFVGTLIYEAEIVPDDGRSFSCGFYRTREEAKMAVAAYAIHQWRMSTDPDCQDDKPWYGDFASDTDFLAIYKEQEKKYLDTHSVEDILTWYFSSSDGDENYKINEEQIAEITSPTDGYYTRRWGKAVI